MKIDTDDKGRILIPKNLRKELGIENGDEVYIELKDNKIIITNPESNDKMQDLIKYLENRYGHIEERIQQFTLQRNQSNPLIERMEGKLDIIKEILDKVKEVK